MLRDNPAGIVAGPREWSLLVKAAIADQLGLKALMFALDSSDKEIIKSNVRTIWDALDGAGVILSRKRMGLLAAGDAIPESVMRRKTAQANAVAPTSHLLFGYLLERQGNDHDAVARALFHFWIAEQMFKVSGRSEEEERARTRRAMLARALPDEKVRAV